MNTDQKIIRNIDGYIEKVVPEGLIFDYIKVLGKVNSNFETGGIFEFFTSIKDKNDYLVTKNNSNIEIYRISNNELIKTLKLENNIVMIKYFTDNIKKEYLLASTSEIEILLWDISNDYKLTNVIINRNESNGIILSGIILFDIINHNDYVIFSSYVSSNFGGESHKMIYNIQTEKLEKVEHKENNQPKDIISWYNKKNKKYYLIELGDKTVFITELFGKEEYAVINNILASKNFSCVVYTQNENDFLCYSSFNGYITIYDLNKKNLLKEINLLGCRVSEIALWSDRFLIASDYNNNEFIIIDLISKNAISSFRQDPKESTFCVKKKYVSEFGEYCLLTFGYNGLIKIWKKRNK